MKRRILLSLVAVPLLPLAVGGGVAQAAPCDPPPVVSTSWLASHGTAPNLVIVDIRTAEEYAAGHLPSAVSIPFGVTGSAWVAPGTDLLLELPDAATLGGVLGAAGITSRSNVVLVSSVGVPPRPQAGATRVAATLAYAGVPHVSILDGGYPKWIAEGRATTTQVPVVTPVRFDGRASTAAFVGIGYLHDSIGRALIVDARDPEVYSGQVIESWADKPGHIPSAVSLPALTIWNADGTFRTTAELASTARGVLGDRARNREILVYCGVGGYASSWLYVLRNVLGYHNVRMYDGSAQEWVKYYDMVM